MRRSHVVAALGLVVVLSPVVIWWAVGDLSADVERPDYVIRPPDLTPRQERAIGAPSALVTAVAVVALCTPAGRRLLRDDDLRVVAPLLALGVFVGGAARVLTAGVIGANIGAGFILLFGVAFVPVMIVIAVASWRGARRRR